MEVKSSAMVDESVLGAEPLTKFQFERIGYFCVDFDSTPHEVCDTTTIKLCIHLLTLSTHAQQGLL